MLHKDLPIYKKGYNLLSLAADVQLNMPRTFKQSLGKRVHDECVEMLLEIGFGNIKIAVMAGSVDELLFGFEKLTGHQCDQSMIKRLAVFEKSAVNDVKGGAS